MKALAGVILALVLGACAHGMAGPKTVTELHEQHVWQHEPGADLRAAMETGFSRIGHREGRIAPLAQLTDPLRQLAGHSVERRGQQADLVPVLNADLLRKIFGGHPFGRMRQRDQRLDRPRDDIVGSRDGYGAHHGGKDSSP